MYWKNMLILMLCAFVTLLSGCGADNTPQNNPEPVIDTEGSAQKESEAVRGLAEKTVEEAPVNEDASINATLEEVGSTSKEVTTENAEEVLEALLEEIEADTE